MEQNTIDIIESLDISVSQKTLLIEAIQWEKELSWSHGFESATNEIEVGDADAQAQDYDTFGDRKI